MFVWLFMCSQVAPLKLGQLPGFVVKDFYVGISLWGLGKCPGAGMSSRGQGDLLLRHWLRKVARAWVSFVVSMYGFWFSCGLSYASSIWICERVWDSSLLATYSCILMHGIVCVGVCLRAHVGDLRRKQNLHAPKQRRKQIDSRKVFKYSCVSSFTGNFSWKQPRKKLWNKCRRERKNCARERTAKPSEAYVEWHPRPYRVMRLSSPFCVRGF